MIKKDQCNKCIGLCCRYFALPIETPETKEDYDDIRWYLCHKNITIFVEDGQWYIEIKNRCRHLSAKDNRCRIYDERPKICRKYRHKDCDYVEGKYEYELHFTNDKQVREHMKIKFDNAQHGLHHNMAKKQKKNKGKKKRK